MEYEYTKKFKKDLLRYKTNEELIHILGKKIQHIAKTTSTKDIHELVTIRKTKAHYRIKIKISESEIYRIGIAVLKNKVWVACIDKDKKRFYKRFP